MRKLMWFTIGFATACGLCAYGLPQGWILPVCFAALVLAAATALLIRKWKPVRRAAAACAGCAVGLVWYLFFYQFYLLPPVSLDGQELEASITAGDYSYETSYGSAVDGILKIEDKTYQVRIYLGETQEVSPGDTITGTFRFQVTAPGGEKESDYYQGKGIFLLAYQRGDVTISETEKAPWWCYPAILRQQIKDILRDCFPEDVLAFAKALLLGDSTDLDYATDTAFKLSGIRHIIAVSGLHISILYSLISFLTARKRWFTALIGIPSLVLFAAVAGFTPSVTRACIMVGLMMLASLVDREYDSPTELAFACLTMLVGNPLVIASVSFQLSVGCVAGILLFSEPIQNWMKKRLGGKGKLQNGFCASVSVTLSAMSLTTPLSAYYFGTVSLIGVVTNLLTLWVVNLVFNGIIVVCLVSLVFMKAASVLGWLLAWPMRFVLFAAKNLAALPMAAVYTESVYIVIWLVFCYVLLAVFLLSRKRRPGVLACCAGIGLCVALLASWTEPLMDDTRITMLDVGQGQSILLQSEGRTYLVDCGGDSDTETADIIAETLLSQGVDRLDGIILTHLDRDHAGALENLLSRIQTDLLFVGNLPEETVLPRVDGEIVYVTDTLELTFGNGKMTIFGPIYSGSSNENSLCVLFDTEKCDILVTGDRSGFGERTLLRYYELPAVDVLVAGHHGAEDSTCEELLRAVQPDVVLISVGEQNVYGHPADALLERLAAFGCTVYRTDQNGTIIYRG